MRSCILFGIVAMAIASCNAVDEMTNLVQADSVNDQTGNRFLRSTEEADDAEDKEERAFSLKSLLNLRKTPKTPNDFSKTILLIDPKFKKDMIAKWGTGYTQEKVISKLKKKDPAMLRPVINAAN